MKWSIIVPMGRPERAKNTFDSIVNQIEIPGAYEIIVVGVKAAEIEAAYPEQPIRAVILPHNMLPPKTRLLGSNEAKGDWMVFIDDDMLLEPDYFIEADRVIEEWPANERPLGSIGCRLPGTVGNYADELVNIGNFWYQQGPRPAIKDWLYSASIVVSSKAYNKIGGFNPTLPNGEDVDLTQRIRAAEYSIYYDPALVAHHNHGRTTLRSASQYYWNNGNTAQHFNQVRPTARCFSLHSALWHAWNDLKNNAKLNQNQVPSFCRYVPFMLIMYFIVQVSMEWHYQQYLYNNDKYKELPERDISDREFGKSFDAFKKGRRFIGGIWYLVAVFKDFAAPIRR